MNAARAIAVALLVLAFAPAGCADETDAFFSGRPSGMAMAHNRALDGSVESMADLLRIPRRFPKASAAHKLLWQESPIAWWLDHDGRKRLLAALPRLTAEESSALQEWLAVTDATRPRPQARALEEIAAAARAR